MPLNLSQLLDTQGKAFMPFEAPSTGAMLSHNLFCTEGSQVRHPFPGCSLLSIRSRSKVHNKGTFKMCAAGSTTAGGKNHLNMDMKIRVLV